MVVAAATGGGPGAARRTGLRPAAGVAAAGGGRRLRRGRCGLGPPGEGHDDGVVIRGRPGMACGDGRGHGPATVDQTAHGRRSGQADGKGDKGGGDVAAAHAFPIGSLGARRNLPDMTTRTPPYPWDVALGFNPDPTPQAYSQRILRSLPTSPLPPSSTGSGPAAQL